MEASRFSCEQVGSPGVTSNTRKSAMAAGMEVRASARENNALDSMIGVEG
jgi:hypothetical protein